MTAPPPDAVLAQYRAGVDAFAEVAGRIDGSGWDLPACGSWTAAETARHVASVAGWYHDWLDRALAGDHSRPFDAQCHILRAFALHRETNLLKPEHHLDHILSHARNRREFVRDISDTHSGDCGTLQRRK